MTSAFGSYYTHRQALVKILLMLLRNYCAKIATKKRKHNTNSTGMSVNLVVCVLAVLSLSGAQKGRGQLCWLVQKRTASSGQPFTGKTLAQPHAVVNAVVDCQLMRCCLISSLSMQTVKKLL